MRCDCPLAPTVPTALALRNIPKGSFMQSVLHSYIPLNSMMGIGYTYVWKNKRMGKEGVPGCRPSVVAAAARRDACRRRAALSHPSVRLPILAPCFSCSYQLLLLHCCRFTNFLSASSNRQLARYTVTTGYITLHSYSLCTSSLANPLLLQFIAAFVELK